MLFRKSVPPKENLLDLDKNKVALVTVAGSIGTEISLQILALKPLKIVAVDFEQFIRIKNLLLRIKI